MLFITFSSHLDDSLFLTVFPQFFRFNFCNHHLRGCACVSVNTLGKGLLRKFVF